MISAVVPWFYSTAYPVSFFFFKQKTSYALRISDWNSDLCSSGLRLIRSPEWILSGGLDYSPDITGGEADFHIGYNYSASYRHAVMGYMRPDNYGVGNA